MAPVTLLKNARTALSPRHSSYSTDTPVAPHSQASSSRTAFIQIPSDRVLPVQSVVLRYEKYQDDMPVKSIEVQEQGFTGIRHYTFIHKQKKLDTKPSLDHIDYRDIDADLTDADGSFETDLETPTYTGPPTPPPSTTTYTQPIYFGTTHNPAIFLAILRIAQVNLPGMNFISALNHIPNIRPVDQLPVLIPSAPGNLAPAPFLDARRSYKKPGDDDISVAFLPYFYGERHGIAYFEYAKDFERGIVLGSACVTPCSEEDLRKYGLVEYIPAEDLAGIIGQGGGDVEGVDMMKSVGVKDGRWLEKDVVEDWNEWRGTFRTCAVHWEGRMRLMRGEHEG